MPKCPYCHTRLPLGQVLSGGITCPGCHRELEPKRWSLVLSFLVGFTAQEVIKSFLRSTGVASVWVYIVSFGAFGAVALLAYIVLVRYRVKTSSSILGAQKDDTANR